MSLVAHLNAQRDHVLGILEGLSSEDLRRPVLPSGWSCLGLVNHLALDVERFWFRAVVAGEGSAISELSPDAWQVAADVPARDVLDLYRQEIRLANAVISSTSASSEPAWWPVEQFGDWRLDSVEEVLLHVITETACHAGHLDAARELIDCKQWMVLT